ncbi:MAG TPA: dihydroneopterin aldolase, partial [Legionellaceae bacterium]|nr:dihydroneopterin aldolase [Legionellaceae bacterium]
MADLKIPTRIGIYPWEQRIQQTLIFELDIPLNIAQCNENIKNTIDYEQLCQMITDFVSTRSFQLLETVADQVTHLIQRHYQIPHLTMTVTKPFAVKNA